ncbi:MAG: hypothetical protein ACYTAN_04080, partial [Planctomycetota bacterium]
MVTILAAVAAIVLGAARREALFFTRLAAADLADGRFPGHYLASSVEQSNLAPALERYLSKSGSSAAAERLAFIEMQAAGLFTPAPDANLVSVEYERLLADYPDSPLVHYRYAAFLLGRLQTALFGPGDQSNEESAIEADDLARRARIELLAAAR